MSLAITKFLNVRVRAAIIVTPQEYLNDAVVEQKREARDYDVQVSPVFELDGVQYRMVVDGNHSLEAARRDGVEPNWEELGGVIYVTVEDGWGGEEKGVEITVLGEQYTERDIDRFSVVGHG